MYGGLRAEVEYADDVEGHRLITGGITTADGRRVGMFARSYSYDADELLVAHHDLLDLDGDVQGQGFAEAFNSHLEAWYRASGVDRIELTANIDVGGYAWARAGYDYATEAEAYKMSLRLQQWIETADQGTHMYDAGPDGPGQLVAAKALLARMRTAAFGTPEYPSAYELRSFAAGPAPVKMTGGSVSR